MELKQVKQDGGEVKVVLSRTLAEVQVEAVELSYATIKNHIIKIDESIAKLQAEKLDYQNLIKEIEKQLKK